MSIEREIDKKVKDVRDAMDEAGHRTVAEGERAKRDLAGGTMSAGDKAKSVANEAKHNIQAEVDKTKRNLRDSF
jgi:hypothetical protein